MTDEDMQTIQRILANSGSQFSSGASGQNQTQGAPIGVPSSGFNPMQHYLESIPGYQFARDEGINAILRGQAAKGVLRTGGTLRGITRYATGLADQTYGNQFNRVLSLADLGQRTAVAPF